MRGGQREDALDGDAGAVSLAGEGTPNVASAGIAVLIGWIPLEAFGRLACKVPRRQPPQPNGLPARVGRALRCAPFRVRVPERPAETASPFQFTGNGSPAHRFTVRILLCVRDLLFFKFRKTQVSGPQVCVFGTGSVTPWDGSWDG